MSQYGQFTRGMKFYDQIKEIVRKEAAEIWSGEFAREITMDKLSGYVVLNRMWRLARETNLAKAERKLYKILGRGKVKL